MKTSELDRCPTSVSWQCAMWPRCVMPRLRHRLFQVSTFRLISLLGQAATTVDGTWSCTRAQCAVAVPERCIFPHCSGPSAEPSLCRFGTSPAARGQPEICTLSMRDACACRGLTVSLAASAVIQPSAAVSPAPPARQKNCDAMNAPVNFWSTHANFRACQRAAPIAAWCIEAVWIDSLHWPSRGCAMFNWFRKKQDFCSRDLPRVGHR